MKLDRTTILELEKILKEEFNLQLNDQDLRKLAYSLVGYFNLLAKIRVRDKFQNHQWQAIESKKQIVLDREEVK